VEAGLPVFHSLRDLARAVHRIIVWKDRARDYRSASSDS
jgi:hypothetical protein